MFKHSSNSITSLKSEKRYIKNSPLGGWGVLLLFLSLLLFSPSAYPQSKQKKSAQKTAVTTKKKTSGKTASTKTSGKATTSKTTKKKGSTKKGSEGNSINSLKMQRDEIKKNIAKQEKALRANKAQVEKKLKDLIAINGEMDRRRQSIDSINHDIHLLDGDIGILNAQLNTLNAQLEARKAQYVKSMRYMAKRRGIQSQMMFIFSGNDFSQIYRRMRFMREYAAYQRTQGKAVQEQQQRVNEKNEQLKAARGVKSNLLWKGKKEHAALEGKKEEQQKVVTSLQKQQKTIQNIIDEQKKKDAALNAKIDQLVAEEVERARQRAIAEAKKKAEEAEAARKKAEAKRLHARRRRLRRPNVRTNAGLRRQRLPNRKRKLMLLLPATQGQGKWQNSVHVKRRLHVSLQSVRPLLIRNVPTSRLQGLRRSQKRLCA